MKPGCFLFPQNGGRDRQGGHNRGPPRPEQENFDIFYQRRTAGSHSLRERGRSVLPGGQPEQERAGKRRAPTRQSSFCPLGFKGGPRVVR